MKKAMILLLLVALAATMAVGQEEDFILPKDWTHSPEEDKIITSAGLEYRKVQHNLYSYEIAESGYRAEYNPQTGELVYYIQDEAKRYLRIHEETGSTEVELTKSSDPDAFAEVYQQFEREKEAKKTPPAGPPKSHYIQDGQLKYYVLPDGEDVFLIDEYTANKLENYDPEGELIDGTWTFSKRDTFSYDEDDELVTVNSGFLELSVDRKPTEYVGTYTLLCDDCEQPEERDDVSALRSKGWNIDWERSELTSVTTQNGREVTTTNVYVEDGGDAGSIVKYTPEGEDKPVYRFELTNGNEFYFKDGKYYDKEFRTELSKEAANKLLDGLTQEQKERIVGKARKVQGTQVGRTAKERGGVHPILAIMKGYQELQGITQITALLFPGFAEQTAEWRAELRDSFCLLAGIENCITSTVCLAVTDVETGNVVAGLAQGQYVSNAFLTAERSQPITLEGLTRPQLIDLLGQTIRVDGTEVDLTTIDLSTLGQLDVRLYHVQYSVTNNDLKKRELKYNLLFKQPNGQTVRWYPANQKLAYGQASPPGASDKYQYSATAYDQVCLTFDPKIPSGGSAGTATGKRFERGVRGLVYPRLISEFCVDVKEYQGGPTTIQEAEEQQEEQEETPPPGEGGI